MSATSEYRLIHAIIGTRNRSGKDFETLYLLTLKNTYTDIRFSETDENVIWEVLTETYVKVWENADEIPEAPELREWMRKYIDEAYHEKTGSGITVFPDEDRQYLPINEQRIAETLLILDERLGIFDAYEDDDYTTTKYTYDSLENQERVRGKNTRTTIKAIAGTLVAAGLILIAVIAVTSISDTVKNRSHFQMRDLDSVIASVAVTEAETLAADHSIIQKTNGWKGEDRTRRYIDETGTPVKESWKPDGERLYYLNRDGFIETGDKDHKFEANGRVYSLYENAVGSAMNAPIRIYGSTFRLSRGKITNQMYCDGSVLFEEGIALTGICGIDKKVYYCVMDRMEDGAPISMIRCFDMDTGRRTTVSAEFQGFMRDMLYDKNTNHIYMAYGETSPETNYEQLAFINLETKYVYVITEDQGVLAERKQNDTGLKIIGGDEEIVYCIKYKPTEELESIRKRLENDEPEPAPDKAAEFVEIPVSKKKRIA